MSSCILIAYDITYCDSYSILQFLFTNQYDHVSKVIKNQYRHVCRHIYRHICQYFHGNLSSLEGYELRKAGFTKQKMSPQTRKGCITTKTVG